MGNNIAFSCEEYMLFLLLYASHVDFKFSPEERQHLKYIYPNKFSHIKEEFDNLNEAERVIVLTDGLVDFKQKTGCQEYKESLLEQFFVDGVYCKFEKSFLNYFTQLEAAI